MLQNLHTVITDIHKVKSDQICNLWIEGKKIQHINLMSLFDRKLNVTDRYEKNNNRILVHFSLKSV